MYEIMKGVPGRQRRFLLVIAILFVSWHFAYNYWMKPAGVPDNFLTRLTGCTTKWTLNLFYNEAGCVWTGRKALISIGGREVLRIASFCNGLELMALYTGILIALPGQTKRKVLFCTTGIAAIFTLNIARSLLLAWMQYRHLPLYDLAHHYVFKICVYAAAFYGWWQFVKDDKLLPEEQTTS